MRNEPSSVRDIVVQLTGSGEDDIRLAHAEALATEFHAHVTGVLINVVPEPITILDPAGDAIVAEVKRQAEVVAQTTYDAVKDRFDRLGPDHELIRRDAVAGRIGRELASVVRTSDLFVGTRPYGDTKRQEWIEEAVLFRSGRPCLFVPPGHSPKPFERVLIAWKDGSAAARAVAGALPFLRRAKHVLVVAVEEDGAAEQYGESTGGDIGRYLSRHGISAEVRPVAGWNLAEDALLNEATRDDADLIVMGGYGHSRFREWMLGGVTRHMLETAPVPILMAH
jgi:nucleotide-binding universal stress UspA family protein